MIRLANLVIRFTSFDVQITRYDDQIHSPAAHLSRFLQNMIRITSLNIKNQLTPYITEDIQNTKKRQNTFKQSVLSH